MAAAQRRVAPSPRLPALRIRQLESRGAIVLGTATAALLFVAKEDVPGNAAAELANARLAAIEENVARQARMVRFARASVALVLAGAILSTAHLTQGDRPDAIRADQSAACDPAADPTGANGCDP